MPLHVEFITKEDLAQLNQKIDALNGLVTSLLKKEVNKKYYTNEELANALNVSTKTLQNWRNEGAIEFTQKGSNIIYTQDNVDDFLTKHRVRKFGINKNHGRAYGSIA